MTVGWLSGLQISDGSDPQFLILASDNPQNNALSYAGPVSDKTSGNDVIVASVSEVTTNPNS